MGYKKFVSLNVAVIGGGHVSDVYAAALVLAGHEVYLADLDNGGTGINPIWDSSDCITICSIEEAAQAADFIIIASQPKDVREVAYWLGDVRRKVVIDATPNVHADNHSEVRTLGAIASITGSQHVTKIFNTSGYEKLLKPLFGKQKVQMIIAGDSRKAKEITMIIARELGITEFYDFGDNDSLKLMDEMAKCWRNMVTPETQLIEQLKAA